MANCHGLCTLALLFSGWLFGYAELRLDRLRYGLPG